MTSPEPLQNYERARRLLSRYCFGVEQHIERIGNFNPDERWSELQNKNDWEVVIVFLTRIRRCLEMLLAFRVFQDAVRRGLDQFDRTLPSLIKLRNFEEHFDDYSNGKGRNKAAAWGHLETYNYGSSEFSNGLGGLSTADAEQAAKAAWAIVLELENEARRLGYRTWDERFGDRTATGE